MVLDCLILIDCQKGLQESAYWGQRCEPNAEDNMRLLLDEWREGQGKMA